MKINFAKTILALLAMALTVTACMDDDDFTLSSAHTLSFGTDTLSLDTTFSSVPTPTKMFWVYNRSGKGIKIANVRLRRGNQTGFRVNVDGTYLGQQAGWQAQDIDVYNKDSIRVFVELTSPINGKNTPQLIEDDLVFRLESGVEQSVCLKAWSWDAKVLRNVHITENSVYTSEKPLLVYGGITVDSAATLTIEPGTCLYFHNDAGIKVFGTLKSLGTVHEPVVMRGDRLDHMFDYLPYDRVAGQWQGVTFTASSFDNILQHTDIHSPFNGVTVDSTGSARQKLAVVSSSVHNCQGYGLKNSYAYVSIENSVISNTLGNTLHVVGGKTFVNNCTLAQFYPFDANRGAAMWFEAGKGMDTLRCTNSLITGYSDDVVMRTLPDDSTALPFAFDHCVLRTEKETTADSIRFTDVVYEDVENTDSFGKGHFLIVDEENLYYDFSLDSTSAAISAADKATATLEDIAGTERDETPDAGAYEYVQRENAVEPLHVMPAKNEYGYNSSAYIRRKR